MFSLASNDSGGCRAVPQNAGERRYPATDRRCDRGGGEDDLQILSCCRPRSRIPALPVICNI